MIFSVASTSAPFIIVMTVDSAIQKAYNASAADQKLFRFAGVGCVTTWGEQIESNIGAHLEQRVSISSHDVNDLAAFVVDYLKNHYKPHERGLYPLGYHVAGFDGEDRPRLYHVFWGFDQYKSGMTEPDYHIYDAGTASDSVRFLYNGENRLAERIVPEALSGMLIEGGESVYDLRQPTAAVRLADFVGRLTAEITPPTAAPPIFSCLISPKNKTRVIRNDHLSPIEEYKITRILRELDYHVGSVNHEDVVQNTVSILRQLTAKGFIFRSLVNAPAPRVYLDKDLFVEPDIFWTGDARGQYLVGENAYWQGVPDLIVEVFAEDSELQDRREKFALYEEYGVREYWMIDPDARYMEVYSLEEGRYVCVGLFGVGETFRSSVLSETVEVAGAFAASVIE